MNTSAINSETSSRPSHKTQQELLDIAHHLDRFGRDAEQFLTRQFSQLERAIDEFEREKAAWRRQVRRETDLLARQSESVRRLREQHSTSKDRVSGLAEQAERDRKNATLVAVKNSGDSPIRLLLQPGKASLMQVGLLMFEISKLNRDMGGRGLLFEVCDVRMPRKRLLSRRGDLVTGGEILELRGASKLPLRARGAHVELDVDVTERITNWIAFKTQLLESSLANSELATVFGRGTSVKRNAELHSVIGDAVRRADDAVQQGQEHSRYAGAVSFANSPFDAAQQQLERLEGCADRLLKDCGLRLHVALAVD